MPQLETALSVLYASLDEVNEQLEPADRLVKAPDTVLFGPASRLDSLGLVTFLVAVERNLKRTTGQRIVLATDERLYGEESPLRTVAILAEYVAQRLGGPA